MRPKPSTCKQEQLNIVGYQDKERKKGRKEWGKEERENDNIKLVVEHLGKLGKGIVLLENVIVFYYIYVSNSQRMKYNKFLKEML